MAKIFRSATGERGLQNGRGMASVRLNSYNSQALVLSERIPTQYARYRRRRYANPRTLRCSVRDRPTVKINKRSEKPDRSFIGAEGGIRTLVWCYPQTDFESVRLLGS